jgi:hypothetical protein
MSKSGKSALSKEKSRTKSHYSFRSYGVPEDGLFFECHYISVTTMEYTAPLLYLAFLEKIV